jgi:KDO2-lipid IV(A) lauroyltransferase
MTTTLSARSPRPRHYLEAGIAHALFALLSLLSPDAASAFGGWLGRAIGPLTGAHGTARRNLARALPELDADAQRRALRDAWDNFGRTMTEYAALPALGRDPSGMRIAVEGHDHLATLATAGKPAILLCAHLGNWEIVPIAAARLMKPLTIVYRPPNNPLVDDIIGGIRASYTAGMAAKGAAGARQIMAALAQGHHVMMVVDQKLNAGLEIPFFGRGAFTGPAVVRFAARFGCPVFPVRTERAGGCHFRMVVEEPWTFPENVDEREALLQVNRRLEEWIRARPGQWLWMHRRWPE